MIYDNVKLLNAGVSRPIVVAKTTNTLPEDAFHKKTWVDGSMADHFRYGRVDGLNTRIIHTQQDGNICANLVLLL